MVTMMGNFAAPSPLLQDHESPTVVERFDNRHIQVVGELYFCCYGPGAAWGTVEESIRDIEASVDGAYGELFPQGSYIARSTHGIVGAVLTVTNSPWSNTPPGPFVIELFVSPHNRRQGVAKCLMSAAARASKQAGWDSIALRVDSGNRNAVWLYSNLGLGVWPGEHQPSTIAN